jgi:hypothetical protein
MKGMRRHIGDRRRPRGGSTRSDRQTRWIWLSAGVGLVAVVGFAVLVGGEFSASREVASRENAALPGIDLAGLDPEQRDMLLTKAAHQPCPCTCGFTLADCRHKDRTCPRSGPILDGMVREYRSQQRSAAPVE